MTVLSHPSIVMEFLGHKSIQHTRRYVQLEDAIFHDEDNAFVCRVAKSVEEAQALIELGFEYVDEIDGHHLYRKRK